MSNSENIQEGFNRIYLFLSKKQNWQTEADYNRNNIIDNSEFKKYLSDGDIDWDGLESNKNDIINKFWQSIDTNRSGKMQGTKSTNAYNLDQNEIDALNAKLEKAGFVNSFIDTKVGTLGVTDEKFQKDFRNQISSLMLEDLNDKTLTDKNDTKIAESYNKFVKQVYANCYVEYFIGNDNTIKELISKNLPNSYKLDEDETFNGIIRQYIESLSSSANADFESIRTGIQSIIKAYLKTADIGDGNKSILTQYGYTEPTDSTTAIQKEKLRKEYTKAIEDAIINDNYYKNYGDRVKSEISKYVADKIKSGSYESLKSAKESIVSGFTEVFNTLKTTIDQENAALNTAKTTLINEIKTWVETNDRDDYKAERLNALRHAFDNAANVQAIIGNNGVIMNAATQAVIDGFRTKFQSAKAAAESAINILKANYSEADACGELAGKVSTQIAVNLTYDPNGVIHTEFGLNADGNIVFEDATTSSMYYNLSYTLKQELKKTNPDAYTKLGEGNIDKLLQAAWIMTYTSFNSSQTNNTRKFLTKVLTNLKDILNSIDKNPQLLDIYTGHTAYADSSLTGGLQYYMGITNGGDRFIHYGAGFRKDPDGRVRLNDEDDNEYTTTMGALLENIKRKYSNLDSDIITEIFRSAQTRALSICMNHSIQDCPYGTTSGEHSQIGDGTDSMVATANVDWDGVSREWDQDNLITMAALVELTLYSFDKFLYEAMAQGRFTTSSGTGTQNVPTSGVTTNDVLATAEATKTNGTVETADGSKKDFNLKDLYDNDTKIKLGNKSDGNDKIKSQLETLIMRIKNILNKTDMFDSDKLESACTNVKDKYISDYMNNKGAIKAPSGVTVTLSFKTLFDDIIAEYNKLAG